MYSGNYKFARLKTKMLPIAGTAMLILVLLLYVNLVKREEKETAISLDEICYTLEFYGMDQEEWRVMLSERVANELRVADVKTITKILGVEKYIVYQEGVSDKDVLTKEIYYSVYEQVLGILDVEDKVKIQEIKVRSTQEITKEHGVINGGEFIFFLAHDFSEINTGTTYRIYSIGMRILGFFPCEEKSEDGVDLQHTKIRVLLSGEQGVEYGLDEVTFYPTGRYKVYYNAQYIQDVSTEEVTMSKWIEETAMAEHERQGDYVVFVPQSEDSRCKICFGETVSNPYRGSLYVYMKASGCYVVNELPVEEYLYSVVPSEMPASYEKEALKAQAVCARSYAYRYLLEGGRLDYYAHVDDTVSFQVYNKTEEQPETTAAVKETVGEYCVYENNLMDTYYYSTSCGATAGPGLWELDKDTYGYLAAKTLAGKIDLSEEEEFVAYINSPQKEDAEFDCRYYRWSGIIKINEEMIIQRLRNRMQIADDVCDWEEGKGYGSLCDVHIIDRDEGGGIKSLNLVFQHGTISVYGEYNIRYCLGGCENTITLNNGEVISCDFLPSAYFYFASIEDGELSIRGGGFGHGIGMSQNGANELAKRGYTYREILEFYYNGGEIWEGKYF